MITELSRNDIRIYEAAPDEKITDTLIRLSKDWEAENSCYGYRANDRTDIEGNRIFIAEENGIVIGYLFGKVCESNNMRSIMPEKTPFFEVEELYVVPSHRSRGIGKELFEFAEKQVKDTAEYIVLSTAVKNWKAIFHFYLDELEMNFWSARLYKKL
ncbi:MAG: GNAT family N-acetyltransferase [Oscillospiraceae bacterium]|nr:GNAT family N-acetyltransferase [Oscillospiraceae bacterium]